MIIVTLRFKKKALNDIVFHTNNDAIIAIFTRNNCVAIIYISRFKLESWKTVPSTALYPSTYFLYPLYSPLSSE
jgi:hypothetical protein